MNEQDLEQAEEQLEQAGVVLPDPRYAEALRRVGSSYPRERLNPWDIGKVFPYDTAGGTDLGDVALGFLAHSILIDNLTGQWAFVPATRRYIAPFQAGVIITINQGTERAWIRFLAPDGFTQPAANAAQTLHAEFCEAVLIPSAGFDVSSLGGQGTQRVDLEQVLSTAIAAAAFAGTLPISLMSSATTLAAFFSAGDLTNALQASQPASTPQNAEGNNAAATITYAAVAGQRHRLTSLSASFSAAPAAVVALTVQDGATTILKAFVGGGVSVPPAAPPLPEGGAQGTVNTAMTVTLAASGTAGMLGDVNASKLTG